MRAIALAFFTLAIVATTAHADGNVLLRFYYSPYAAGTIRESPADPQGDKKGEVVDSTWKGDLEVILWGRLGISGSRQNVLRDFEAGGQPVHEEWVQYSYNLTLYLREAGYNRFNLFAGAGTGQVEKYRYSVDGTRLDTRKRHTNLPLTRAFGGVDYTFERIGLRYEYSAVEVEKETPGFTDRIKQAYHHIGIFIPFN
jgi:hypothetical protein